MLPKTAPCLAITAITTKVTLHRWKITRTILVRTDTNTIKNYLKN
jgi:hypothetical protein